MSPLVYYSLFLVACLDNYINIYIYLYGRILVLHKSVINVHIIISPYGLSLNPAGVNVIPRLLLDPKDIRFFSNRLVSLVIKTRHFLSCAPHQPSEGELVAPGLVDEVRQLPDELGGVGALVVAPLKEQRTNPN